MSLTTQRFEGVGEESDRSWQGEENGEKSVAEQERYKVPRQNKENDSPERVGSVEAIMIGRWRKIKFIELSVGAKGALYQEGLRFEKRFVCKAGFKFLPIFLAASRIQYSTLREGMRYTASARSRVHRCEAGYLTTGMVDIQPPRLAVESLGGCMSDTIEADYMGAGGARCHLLKSGAREATLAFVEGVCLFGFLLVKGCSYFQIFDFKLVLSPITNRHKNIRVDLRIQFWIPTFPHERPI